MALFMEKQRRIKNGSPRSLLNFCPNCSSRLTVNENKETVCSGDKLDFLKKEAAAFITMNNDERIKYLSDLDNPSRFLELVNINTGDVSCSFNNRISHTMADNSVLIPDPMAVTRLERKLSRRLTEEELEEGHEFYLDSKLYLLPFVRFPDDV